MPTSDKMVSQRGRPEGRIDAVLVHLHKISLALYMVTDIVSDEEPLKWALRTLIVETTTTFARIQSISTTQQAREYVRAADVLEELSDLLAIGVRAHIISSMNGSILREEIQALLETLGNVVIDDIKRDVSIKNILENAQDFKGHSQGHKNVLENVLYPASPQRGVSSVRPHISGRPSAPHVGIARKASQASSPARRGDGERRTIILAALKKRGSATVREIKDILPETVSEKTVQRELQALVKEGVVRRVGERRWSTYELV